MFSVGARHAVPLPLAENRHSQGFGEKRTSAGAMATANLQWINETSSAMNRA